MFLAIYLTINACSFSRTVKHSKQYSAAIVFFVFFSKLVLKYFYLFCFYIVKLVDPLHDLLATTEVKLSFAIQCFGSMTSNFDSPMVNDFSLPAALHASHLEGFLGFLKDSSVRTPTQDQMKVHSKSLRPLTSCFVMIKVTFLFPSPFIPPKKV